MSAGKPIDTAQLTALWKSGLSSRAIGAHLGVNATSVCRAAARLGLSRRLSSRLDGRHEQPKPVDQPKQRHTYATVQDLVASGMTQRQALCAFHRRRM